MATPQDFEYSALDARGTKVSGVVSAASLPVARGLLQIQGLTKINLKKKSEPFFRKSTGISAEHIMRMYRELATMLVAGIPLVQALAIIGEGYPPGALKDLCKKIKSDLENGKSFSAAIKMHPQHFDTLTCSLIESGELSGTLDVMMGRIATYKEKTNSMRKKIKKAMYYPCAVLLVAFIVTSILLLKVVPTFKDLFSSYGSELPAFTQFVLHISEMLQHHGLLVLISVVFIFFLCIRLYRTHIPFRNFIQSLSLKLPIFGAVIKKAIVARFARTLATTSAAGVPLIDSLEAVSIAANNIVYYQAIQDIKTGLESGQQMGPAMRKTGVFPIMVCQMVNIGEESGALEDMLAKVANIYEEDLDNSIDGLTSLLEPLIMLVLGVVVGGLVIAMYLPIFKMGSLM